MVIGTHGSTYGGNPLAMAAGQAVFDVILEDGFMDQVKATGERLRGALEQLIPNHDHLFESIRSMGLMLGIKISPTAVRYSSRICATTARPADGRGGRQCRAHPATAEHRTGSYRRMYRETVGGGGELHAAGSMSAPALRHFLNLSDAGGDAIAAMLADAIDPQDGARGLAQGRVDADAACRAMCWR